MVTLRVTASIPPTPAPAPTPATPNTPAPTPQGLAPLTAPSAATPPPTVEAPPPPPPPAIPVRFGLEWLLEHGSPPVQYRAITEVARLTPTNVGDLSYAYGPALRLALTQQSDGRWGGGRSMLGVPSARAENFDGIGTISAVRRLLEYGWNNESPPVVRVRRLLFRLLAEDNDPAYLFEFAPKGKPDEDLTRRGRAVLREAAAAALAQAGYEADPRLRGAARRILDRVNTYLKSPLAERPWVRVANRQVLAAEAAPPSIFALIMLAHMPFFRSEYHEHVERLYTFLTQPLPRQESAQVLGATVIAQPHLVLGDMLPHRNAVDADVPAALMWLELMARLGFLRRNENWSKLFDRFVDDCDREGVWHPHKGMAMPRSTSAYVWPMYPLEEAAGGDERWADVTLRIGIIGRAAGRTIELV
jgi:hypothetical protein